MRASVVRLAEHRTPLIKFIGRRTVPKSIDHTPQPHPASPTNSLPDSFAAYRAKAQQHGPLGGTKSVAKSQYAYGLIGGHSGSELGPIKPSAGEFFDRNELPARFRRSQWSAAEIEAIESGGASLFA
ncbi:hypothetical protein UCRPC4_g00432 [Phaeomoniella chlamydospora]|uniref:Uncharacterized protein n=1 Tax=Phaeomoniella chlamydospora TaxID=158046 RepID=A0A0G2F1E0_PHACM|nr:hypothetical protein UCRPC4_g00432 [Phaeomoniella chlamydospora]